MSLPQPNAAVAFVDEKGRLTPYGQQVLQAILAALASQDARIEALEP